MAGQAPQPPRDPLLAAWFALGLIFALLIAGAGALLGWLGSRNIATAVLTGFGAFGGTITLVVLVINLFRR